LLPGFLIFPPSELVPEGMTRNNNKKKTRKYTAYDRFHLAKSHPRRTNQNALI